MGDGRYYTVYQFCTIVFLTVFLTGISISTVMCVYQGIRQKGRPVFLAHLSLGLAAVFRFAEEVLASRDFARTAKGGELVCILISLAAISGMLNRDKPRTALVHRVFSLISGSLLAGALWHPQWLVDIYFFSDLRFGILYLFIAGLWLVYATTAGFLSKSGGMVFLFIFPLAVHLAGVMAGGKPGNLGLLALYPFWLAFINIVSADTKDYRIGSQVFANINNLIKDAVVVCDPDNKIIYRNRHAREADFLIRGRTHIPGKAPEGIFSKDMTRCRKYDFNTFTPENHERYMDCQVKEIRLGKRLVGRTLVISDITDLISMLDIQAGQKARLEAVNQKLDHYSNIVFDLEKEKEISSLLTGITQTQEQFMESFRQRIKALEQMGRGKRFDSRVKALIEDAKNNLAGVRHTVARYRRYYGTEN